MKCNQCGHEAISKRAYNATPLTIPVSKYTVGERSSIYEALDTLGTSIHETAKEKGWWDKPRNDGECIALMHSELSEALEGLRKDLMDDHLPDQPMVVVEFADTVIRIMDLCKARGWDLGKAILAKAAYNEGRPRMHGGKKF